MSCFQFAVPRSTPSLRLAAGVFLTGFLTQSALLADVRLHPLFTDHAVLQRNQAIPVWGTAEPGEKVTVEFAGDKQIAVADTQGKWLVRLGSQKGTSEGRTLRATGKNKVEIQDVVVGEVWVCSGQSNMEWPLNRSFEATTDIQSSNNSELRLFTVVKRRASTPKTDLDYAPHSWAVSGPNSTPNFSAVGYYFGRDLQKALGVPVGLIHTSWGGSPAEVWMSGPTLSQDPAYTRDILIPYGRADKNYRTAVAQWETAKAAAEKKGEKFTAGRPWAPWEPSELYNGMVLPLIPYAIKGAIWYQGESNADRAWEYRSLFADMITNWRRDWGQGNFTFLAVQLAPWDRNKKRSLEEIAKEPGDSTWAELREAQNYVAQTLPKTGVAVITDIGDKDDIHPTRKAPVGARLALAARKIAYYDQKLDGFSPTPTTSRPSKGHFLVNFRDTADGLRVAGGGAAKGFQIAGADRVWHWASAVIKPNGKTVELSCPDVPNPVAARYGWSDYPVVNLENSAGLPVSPFRTDNWPLVSQPK